MKIKRLEIVGFKSFVDKVALDFQHGVTGVIGPNGCGKSNVVDAIRWAMGEQNVRHLRGRAMEDVIFGGSETRKPHGMAQVSIVFDNSAKLCPESYRDFSEIMVTRRLFRSGDSEYLINKTPCRLLDITELFMDTGVGARAYSIIEQGKVGMLVSAKPSERRVLIEEVAGVTKFKSRKKSALRKMDATRQNLIRLSDIISEVSRQISSLKRQAQRAERFRDLRADYKRIELNLSGNRYQRLLADVAIVAEQEKENGEVLARLDSRLEEGDLRLEELQLLVAGSEQAFTQSQERVYQLGAEVQRVENELSLTVRQTAQLKQAQDDHSVELKSLGLTREQLVGELEAVSNRREGVEQELLALEQVVTASNDDLQKQLDQVARLNAEFESVRARLMELFTENSRLANRREEIDRRLIQEAERRAQTVENSSLVRQQLQQIRDQRDDVVGQLLQVRESQSEATARLESLQEQIGEQKGMILSREESQQALSLSLNQVRSRYDSLSELQHNFEGYEDGTRVLLEHIERRPLLSDIIRVPPQLEVALESALGQRLQAVPSHDLEEVPVFVDLLSQHQSRAAIATSPSTLHELLSPVGELLLSKVKITPGSEPLARQLLSGVYFVSSVLECLGHTLPPGILLVDNSGQCLDWQGLLIAGNDETAGGGLLRRQRQLEELKVQESELEIQYRSELQQLESLRDNLLSNVEEKQLVTSELHRLDLEALDLGKDRQAIDTEEERLNKRLELIVFDLAQIDENEGLLQEEKESILTGQGDTQGEQQHLERSASILAQQLEGTRNEIDNKREVLTQKKVQLASMQQQQQAFHDTIGRIKNQQSDLNFRIEQLQDKQKNIATDQSQLVAQTKRLEIELNLLLDRRVDQQQENDKLREVHEARKAEQEEFREQLRRVRGEAEELRKVVTRLQLRHHELQVDAESVRQSILERYRVDLFDHQVPEATEDELERQQQQLRRLQQKIDAIGEVNLMAIEEYREQEERYDFLSKQRDDLNQALDDLQKAITQINRTTRRRFKETFEQVNETFKQVYPRLFRGGQAELLLTDEGDLLETGVEIIVQPPGKRLQNVNLLSGGEKALTAVALIFSLFLIKPTPFCILDEVDAPLDDANIDRFAEMVKEMTAQSQFIIITHSKRTMRVIDTMYGVTMQEPGVSKLVSVRMNDHAS